MNFEYRGWKCGVADVCKSEEWTWFCRKDGIYMDSQTDFQSEILSRRACKRAINQFERGKAK
jgi:hypothetical protein